MDDDSNERVHIGFIGVGVGGGYPRQDLCIVHPTSQSLQTCDRIQASLRHSVHFQTTLIPSNNDTIGTGRRVRISAGQSIESKMVASLTSLEATIRRNIKI